MPVKHLSSDVFRGDEMNSLLRELKRFQCLKGQAFAIRCVLFILVSVLTVVYSTGCGSANASGPSNPPPPQGNTQVTLLASSTANDQLTQFNLSFNSITLTGKSGNTVTLFPGYEYDEFIHLNGKSEPLFTTTIPEDTYTSATATIGTAFFNCMGAASPSSEDEVASSFYAYGNTPDSNVQMTLPEPITVSGNAMTVLLNLQVSQSASWQVSECFVQSGVTGIVPTDFAITPTFSLTDAASAQTAMNGLSGLIASVNASSGSFTVTTAYGTQQEILQSGSTVTSGSPVWTVKPGAGAVFQGVSGISALTAGMPVNFDAALQPDGSLAASRIAVQDTDTADLTLFSGPVASVSTFPGQSAPALLLSDVEEQGVLNFWQGPGGFTFGNAVFEVSGQVANIQNLPFTASFSASNMVAGQWISATSHAPSFPQGSNPAVSTVTLLPQTIDGTVTAVSSQGGFDTYTVSLAAYDLFPQLAVQTYQPTLLTNPGTVIIYADNNTKQLNTQSIATGSVLRFNGVIFNDGGTLRMDCLQIDDGVPQ
jgi:hypothetical protein